MASIYRRTIRGCQSPFYWVKFRDPVTGKTIRESTGLRISDAGAAQKANRRRAELEVRELSAPSLRNSERWEVWARPYLESRYSHAGSLKNALSSLADILVFCREHHVGVPRLLNYDKARAFMPWRMAARTLPRIGHNTARLRVTYFTVLMSEAIRRGFAESNPFREVKVSKAHPKVKREISHEDQAIIERLLEDAKPWMGEQWLVLMRQGCRIAETLVPMDRVDETRMTITFRLKGGKLHTAPLHPDLLPLVATARREGRPTLIVAPPAYNAVWCVWFKTHGLPYSPHCTRVTVITRLLRADFPPAKVCALIGHSEAVNVIYRRLTAPDVRGLLDALSSSPASAIPSPQIPGAPPARPARAVASSGPGKAARSRRGSSR